MRKAFTLLELLVCIAIMVVVAGIAFPVFATAKRSAKRSAAISNMHQLYIGVALYRTDEGKDGIYGDPCEMGLPCDTGTVPSPYLNFMEKNREFWHSPCGLNPSWYPLNSWEPSSGPLISIIYRPSDANTYREYATAYRQNSLLFYDVNCDDPGTPIENPHFSHRGIGVLVEGQLINKYRSGKMLGNDSWWSSPAGG